MVNVSGTTPNTNVNAQVSGVDAAADGAAANAVSSAVASGVGGAQSTVLPDGDTDALDVDALIRNLVQLALKSGKDALEDANGAPGLEAPASSDAFGVGSMTEDEMMFQLQQMRTTLMQKQIGGVSVTLNRAMNDTISRNKERTVKLLDQMAKAYKAMHPKHSFWSWIVKIVSVVVAVVVVVAAAASALASGGLASPLLAIAVIGLAAATTALASQIANKPFSLASLVGEGFGKLLNQFGVKGGDADNIGKIIGGSLGVASIVGVLGDPSFASELIQGAMTLAHVKAETIAIVSAVVTVVCVIVAAAVAAKGSSGATASGGSKYFSASTTQLLGNMAKAAKALGAVTAGVGGVIGGIETRSNAQTAHDAAMAQADLQRATAESIQQQAVVDKLMKDLEKVMDLVKEAVGQMSDMVSSKAASRDAISQNLGSIGA